MDNKRSVDLKTITVTVCLSLSLSLAVSYVQYRSGLVCSGGQEGEGQSEGGAGDCVQICRRSPEKRSSHHLCMTTLTCTSSHYLFNPQEGTTSQIFMFLSSDQT